MKKAILILVAILFVLLGLGTGAGPSPLQTSLVPPEARWLIHIDVEKLTSSVLFKMVTEGGGAAEVQRKTDQFFEKFRIDPLKDLKAVTIFGLGEDNEEPVVAVSGNLDRSYLLGLAKAAPDYQETVFGKYKIVSWKNKHFAAFVSDSLVLISEHEKNIQTTLANLEGQTKPSSMSSLLAGLVKESPNALLLAAADDIPGRKWMGKNPPPEKPVMLSKMRKATCALTEIGENAILKIGLTTESAQAAKDVEQVVRGFLGLASLQLKEETASELTRSISVTVDGDKVRIDASYPTLKLIDLLKKGESLQHLSFDNFRPLP
jgi:hypothetical protein